jgi:hypothetical protein
MLILKMSHICNVCELGCINTDNHVQNTAKIIVNIYTCNGVKTANVCLWNAPFRAKIR